MLVAEMLGGEIVAADSMQVYRGMDIGTAKPTAEQRARIPHHLLDILDPTEPFTVAEYQALADAAIADIWNRNRQPILVGGSGLYVRAVLEEMDFARVPPDPALRQRLSDEVKARGLAALYQQLTETDAATAARIHPNDEKRIIRALEVAAARGHYKLYSPSQEVVTPPVPRREGVSAPPLQTWRGGKGVREHIDQPRTPRYPYRQYGLTRPREELYHRIEARVDTMLAAGLVEEVRALWKRGCDERLVSMKGLGYAQLLPHLRGEASLVEAVERLKRDTRRFAKRQLTWFRADPTIMWIDVTETGGLAQAAELIVKEWREG